MINLDILTRKTPGELFQADTEITDFQGAIPEEQWPSQWKKIHYKNYPRFKSISLPGIDFPQMGLLDVLEQRSSQRIFSTKKISIEEVSAILKYSVGIRKKSQPLRYYPSGGKRYPIETYILPINCKSLEQGVYHYGVENHCLTFLWKAKLKKKIGILTGQEWVSHAGAVIILTAIFSRNKVKYSERALRYSYMETGHIAQNIYLTCTAFHLNCCAIGGFIDKDINNLLDIDGQVESALYLIAIGK